MAEKPQHKRTVKKDRYIGRGAYGIVHRARLGKEVCAAKTLHSMLWNYEDPGADKYLQEFIKECNILKLLSHKNIVKYLGMYTDNETKMPVLLMELCDENLTKFLDNSPDTLPYHVELNIGHDIALALVYLHSKNLIHRDLSSNNVLMVKNNRVKVSDFGMSKLVRVNPNSPLSLCPGSEYYMSPQALDEPPNYTEKLDVFSAGVLLAQIMTRQSPKPSPRLRPVPGSENVYEVVPEIQRRAVELKLIRDSHPMKKVSIQCLEDSEEKCLSSEELEKSLKGLRQEDEYTESMEETHRNLHEQLQKLNEQISRKHRSKHPSLSSPDDDGDMLKMKILLVGESGVGKTCIAQAYDGKDFQKRSHTLAVDTILKTIDYEGENIQLCLWDSVGQEHFQSITRSYYRYAQGVLVVYDITSEHSFSMLPHWLKTIDDVEDDGIERILVGNKSDWDIYRRVSTEDGQMLAKRNGIPFIETSAKTNHNIEEAFAMLVQKILMKQPRRRNSVQVRGEINFRASDNCSC